MWTREVHLIQARSWYSRIVGVPLARRTACIVTVAVQDAGLANLEGSSQAGPAVSAGGRWCRRPAGDGAGGRREMVPAAGGPDHRITGFRVSGYALQSTVDRGFIANSVDCRTLEWESSYRLVENEVARHNRHARACLEHWRDGDDLRQTAAKLGISREYVKKLRRRIRRTALAVVPHARAA
jgi:DNA-binding CsgD family transcriptional regulator